ncbi:DUF3592 domain-containing protein [Nostoc spongiaeforme FACHB-130]|uniref:DUF3592 domain-containing protein n=1 Tax=Nostoc spongiaeforme FACHB-130 TaxID=1357510 RepID=A0ABR8FXP0_9NOSO|nr:DUF3592 domain-containing protein [Nostoc spongiaeforme]MBD2596190.1 DUF3592 domain-containing protein [Nostoc spongiaeforme FACHB-130]
MPNQDVTFFRIFGSIFAGIGSIFLITGIIIAIDTRSFSKNSIPAQGTVINVVKHKSRDSKGRSSTIYYPVIKFTANSGKVVEFEAGSGSNPPAYSPGQQVEILYNPQEPESAAIHSWFDLWFLPIMFIGMGSLFVVIGGIPLIKSFLSRS